MEESSNQPLNSEQTKDSNFLIESRLKELEIRADNYEKIFKNQLDTVTKVFTLSSLFIVFITVSLGFLGFFNTSKVSEAIEKFEGKASEYFKRLEVTITNIEARADRISERMDNKFEKIDLAAERSSEKINNQMREAFKDIDTKLAGGLKFPEIKILYNGEELNNKIIEADSIDQRRYRINSIRFVNTGTGVAERFSVKLFSDTELYIQSGNEPELSSTMTSTDPEFKYCNVSFAHDIHKIRADGDRWDIGKLEFVLGEGSNVLNIKMKIIIFYGQLSSQANFIIKLK